MTIKNKLTTGIASAALLMASFAPAAFADTITIQGNGADSNNKVETTNTNSNTVVQSNETEVANVINVSSSTGGNKANNNTGGDVDVKTGNSKVNVTTSVTGSLNVANVNSCCECGGVTDVLIKNNGADSKNTVKLGKSNNNTAVQSNKTGVANLLGVLSKTGKNKANKNTGGSVLVDTGKSKVNVDTSVTGSTNVLNQTGCCCGSQDPCDVVLPE